MIIPIHRMHRLKLHLQIIHPNVFIENNRIIWIKEIIELGFNTLYLFTKGTLLSYLMECLKQYIQAMISLMEYAIHTLSCLRKVRNLKSMLCNMLKTTSLILSWWFINTVKPLFILLMALLRCEPSKKISYMHSRQQTYTTGLQPQNHWVSI